MTVFDLPGVDPEKLSPAAQVKAAIAAAGTGTRVRGRRFAFDHASPREMALAPLLGIYLGFAVARLHERFPVFAVPMLLSALMAIMLVTLIVTVPSDGWRKTWKASPQLRLVGLLAVLACVTVPFGIWMSGALDFLLNRFTIALAVYIACIFLLRDRKLMRRVIMIYVAITVAVAGRNLYAYFTHDLDSTLMTPEQKADYLQTGDVTPELLRQSFGSLDPNDIAAVMATTFPLALWLAAGGIGRRMVWMPCALVLAIAIIPTVSRGGFLGLLAATIVLCLVGARGGKRVFLIAALAAAGALFLAVAGSHMDRMEDIGGSDYNFTASEGRLAIWKRGIVWTIKRPWGYGLDNFPTYFSWMNGPARAAHNSLIQYSVELGVLGITAYLLICGTLVVSLIRMRRAAMRASPPDPETTTLTGHVLAMLAGCWVTGFFLSNAYYPMTYMAIGIGSAVVLSGVPMPDAPASPSLPKVAAAPVPLRRRRHLKAFETA